MSKSENILAFEAALQGSKELQEKFVAAQKRIFENKSLQNHAFYKASDKKQHLISRKRTYLNGRKARKNR